MPLQIDTPCDRIPNLEEKTSILSHNLDMQVGLVLSAKHKLSEESHDSEYNEFGNPRRYENPYPADPAEAREKFQKARENFRRFLGRLAEAATYPSVDVAEHLAVLFGSRDGTKTYTVKTETRDGATFLLVVDAAGEAVVVDVDTEIGEGSRRNMLEEEKTIRGVTYSLYSFIPPEYRKTFDFCKTRMRDILNQEVE